MPSAPPPPPPPASASAPSAGGAPGRGALLSSIQKGTKLRKATTIDRSAPLIAAAGTSAVRAAERGESAGAARGGSAAPSFGIGGLFGAGIPKLRPTGAKFGAASDPFEKRRSEPAYSAPALPAKPAVDHRHVSVGSFQRPPAVSPKKSDTPARPNPTADPVWTPKRAAPPPPPQRRSDVPAAAPKEPDASVPSITQRVGMMSLRSSAGTENSNGHGSTSSALARPSLRPVSRFAGSLPAAGVPAPRSRFPAESLIPPPPKHSGAVFSYPSGRERGSLISEPAGRGARQSMPANVKNTGPAPSVGGALGAKQVQEMIRSSQIELDRAIAEHDFERCIAIKNKLTELEEALARA